MCRRMARGVVSYASKISFLCVMRDKTHFQVATYSSKDDNLSSSTAVTLISMCSSVLSGILT